MCAHNVPGGIHANSRMGGCLFFVVEAKHLYGEAETLTVVGFQTKCSVHDSLSYTGSMRIY